MIINIPEIKNQLKRIGLVLVPILLGLFNNFVFLSDNSSRIGPHFILILFPSLFIIGALTSLNIFQNKKRIQNYILSIISICYTEFIVFMGLMMDNSNFGIKSFPTIILYIFNIYGFYLSIIGISNLGSRIKSSIRNWLRKRNIHVINSSTKDKLINNFPELDLKNPIDFEERFSGLNSDIVEINRLLTKHTDNIISKVKLIEHDSISIKKKLISESDKLISTKGELERLEKLKNISEEQIDALLNRQNKSQFYFIFVGFILGIIGSLIANYIYENFKL